MEKLLLKRLSETTDEEKRILAGLPFEPKLYFSDKALIKSEKMLGAKGAEIGIKAHPRYAAFPEHGHDFVEMMIVLSGSITHRLDALSVTLRKGDILLMNKHVRHSIDRAEKPDLGVNIIMTDGFALSLSGELENTVFADFLKDNTKSDGTGAFLQFRTEGNKPAENLIENIIFELNETKTNTALLSRTLALLFSYLASKEDMLVEASTPEDVTARRKAEIAAYI